MRSEALDRAEHLPVDRLMRGRLRLDGSILHGRSVVRR